MDAEQAKFLIAQEKYIVEKGKMLDNKSLHLQSPISLRFDLVSAEDPEQVFFVDIKESEKKAFKISMHHQDDATQYPILRVDYYSRHKNPEFILDSVPQHFRPYAGKYLEVTDYPGHIHYVVDGYKSLAWAIPLLEDDFEIKDIKSIAEVKSAIATFFNTINLKTTLDIQIQSRLI